MSNTKEIIIAGGGAAGMVAAIAAVREGAHEHLFEKNDIGGFLFHYKRKDLRTGFQEYEAVKKSLMVGKHNEPVFFGQVFHAMGFNCHAACLIGGEGCLFTPPEAFLIADAFMDTAPPDVAEIINGFKKKPEDHQGYSTHI